MPLLPQPDTFLKEILKHLAAKQLNINDLFIDHICYRLSSNARYDELKTHLTKLNELLVESKINGRNISVFKLKEPIKFGHWEIPLLELPAPKSGSHYSEGWEHIEVVTNEPLESFMQKHPDLDFDLKGFTKPLNREVRLKLGKYSFKFHEQSLEEVIEIEKGNKY